MSALYRKILIVVDPNWDAGFLNQALETVKNSAAKATILFLQPELPGDMQDFIGDFQNSHRQKLKAELQKHGLEDTVKIEFDSTRPPLITVIRYALKHNNDLVIKQAESLSPKGTQKGFKSMDMGLLRKCPCMVWIYKTAIQQSKPKFLIAVDPRNEEQAGYDLNVKLLKNGKGMADSLGGSFEVISCWHLEHENFLRDSAFAKMDKDKVDALVDQEREQHFEALTTMMEEAGVEEIDRIVHLQGKPEEMIPAYIDENEIDVLVMGTVARTGIPGFIVGNTAENILQNVTCDMMADKPNGFVSPVKAY